MSLDDINAYGPEGPPDDRACRRTVQHQRWVREEGECRACGEQDPFWTWWA